MCWFIDVAGVLFVEGLGLLRQAEAPVAPVDHDLAGHMRWYFPGVALAVFILLQSRLPIRGRAFFFSFPNFLVHAGDRPYYPLQY